ncbi:MAG: hypothetical protein QGD92_09620 [Gammaproteobacteria bacterium]|nr:hypothetical protein [Gammaproteobacteria bacterium]
MIDLKQAGIACMLDILSCGKHGICQFLKRMELTVSESMRVADEVDRGVHLIV